MEVIEIDEKSPKKWHKCDNESVIQNYRSVDCSLTYNDFFSEHLLPNLPCVIQSGITNEWTCAQQWRVDEAPNFKCLKQLYGESKVPVANCGIKYYNAQLKETMKIEKFIDYWQEYRNNNYPCEMPLLYLKDWHCLRAHPNAKIYKVPKYFGSDWLNEYYLAHPHLEDDYMFVYMGPKGSWTPLHVDVFASYSWSANIVGKKRWLLFPPGEEDNLCDARGHLPYDIDSPDNNLPLKQSNKSLEIVQGPGEIVFVPSGWHHQVWNLEDTISINHNWINGCNIWNIWRELKTALVAVMKEIDDCSNMDNWPSQCQLLLKASHGMDYVQFYQFLSFIIERRLDALRTRKSCVNFDTWQLGINHTVFDVHRAKSVLISLIKDTKEKNICDIIFADGKVEQLVQRIEATLKCTESMKIA
ncbi:2-oxoglutarate and iron-dependent oxygenase JMJD4 [Diachasmimorpha longicaudata]|uniref:2-oxoglutarate and iron-dependent oxygenase JMJD4 n=1 Tax=Diachasmimorpha longicaudata TaxID=58733 RepID=UPI0030B8D071